LIIRGEKKEEREDKDRNYHVRERVQGDFSRNLTLPFERDHNQVKDNVKDGVANSLAPTRSSCSRTTPYGCKRTRSRPPSAW
jgi:HSP20 family protein